MRKSGILLPIFSLPNEYGIGTIGKTAYEFIDFLADCSQYYWQILPINPTACSNSPYQCTSAFAGNPYFIDPEMLFDMDLLTSKELENHKSIQNERVNYPFLYRERLPLIKLAASRLRIGTAQINTFREENKFWLEDYCFYTALSEQNNMRPVVKNVTEYLHLKEELKNEIALHEKIQYLFFYQWESLKQYANVKKVHIIGDLPIYVSEHSSDFFAYRHLFCCSETGRVLKRAGCPPDNFAPKGQLWENPLYDWQSKQQECLFWWKQRFHQAKKLFDCVRIDHFRGFYEYYAIPCDSDDATTGEWMKGPGESFTSMLKKEFPDLDIIAEDLGFITPEVREFLESSGYPGMKILQFAFDENDSEHLPHNHIKNAVCYTGTHDNPTVLSWLCQSSDKTITRALDYFGALRSTQLNHCFIMGAMASVCDTAIVPLQDYMDVGCKGRINTPGTQKENWEYRLPPNYATKRLKEKILFYTKTYSRNIQEET